MHFLLNLCGAKFFFREMVRRTGRFAPVHEPSSVASLDWQGAARKIDATSNGNSPFFAQVTSLVHRFQECIAGRLYLIEAAPVSENRWRAYIVRVPGVPTALMPFYGQTPDEAVQQLSEWLTRAHQRASGPPRSS